MSSPDLNAFAKYIPGFEFLQNLSRQAAGNVAPGLQSGVPGMPQLSHWVAPTFDVEELDKRIQDLRAVHFWLDQNTKALGATIQALEVQKMTLATLKGMNVSMTEMAEAFKIKPEQAEVKPPEPTPSPAPAAAAEPPAPSEEAPGAEQSSATVDPMQWWNALTQQFQTIAGSALQDMAEHASRAAETVAQTVQAGAEAASQMGATDATATADAKPARAPAAKTPAKKAPSAKTSAQKVATKAAGKKVASSSARAKPARKTG